MLNVLIDGPKMTKNEQKISKIRTKLGNRAVIFRKWQKLGHHDDAFTVRRREKHPNAFKSYPRCFYPKPDFATKLAAAVKKGQRFEEKILEN